MDSFRYHVDESGVGRWPATEAVRRDSVVLGKVGRQRLLGLGWLPLDADKGVVKPSPKSTLDLAHHLC